MRITRRQGLAAAAALIAAPRIGFGQGAGGRCASSSMSPAEPRPIASPSFVTRNFGYMVFDTLVSLDGKGEYKPQMLEGWVVSADRLHVDLQTARGPALPRRRQGPRPRTSSPH